MNPTFTASRLFPSNWRSRDNAECATVYTGALGGGPWYAAFRESSGWTVSESLRTVADFAGATIDWGRVAELRSTERTKWPDGLMSFLTGVHVLESNSTYRFEESEPVCTVAHERHDWVRRAPLTPAGLIRYLTDSFRYLEAAGPPLLLLSGGLDSALLAVVLAEAGIAFDAACISNGSNAEDVGYAQALAIELGLPFTVYEFDYETFIRGLPSSVAAFCDPRPDLFLASGVVSCLSAIGRDRYAVVVGGEPADAILGGLRTQVTAPHDDARAAIRMAALRSQVPRDIAILQQSSTIIGADAFCPYAFLPLVEAALSADWKSLLDPAHAILPTTELGGAGYKILQSDAAELLGSEELRRIAKRTKRGLPSSAAAHWRKLQAQLSSGRHGLDAMLTLGVHLFEELFVEEKESHEVSIEDAIEQVRSIN
ncbi:asparagine synthase-related protein [Nocardia gipuzkoensis]